jgi:hypothetical protein
MSIKKLLLREKKDKEAINSHQYKVWGLWVPEVLQLTYKLLAMGLGVPIYALVGHVLRQWLAENYETLLNDDQKRQKFAQYLAETQKEGKKKDG